MGKINIITIGREYASGGRDVGKAVAEGLRIPFYNKEIFDMAAEKLGMSADDVRFADETKRQAVYYTGMSLMSNISASTVSSVK